MTSIYDEDDNTIKSIFSSVNLRSNQAALGGHVEDFGEDIPLIANKWYRIGIRGEVNLGDFCALSYMIFPSSEIKNADETQGDFVYSDRINGQPWTDYILSRPFGALYLKQIESPCPIVSASNCYDI